MRSIPRSFKILGHTITVELVDDLVEKHKAYGLCLYHEHRILLQVPTEDLKITPSHLLQTFWHEYFHMALYSLGHQTLADDEALVDQLGQVVHQALKTKKA